MNVETVCPGDPIATAEDVETDMSDMENGSESTGTVTTDDTILSEPELAEMPNTTDVKVADAARGGGGCALRGVGVESHHLGLALGLLAMAARARRRR